MAIGGAVWRALVWAAVTACTAGASRWLRDVLAERPGARQTGASAACDPAAARDQQRLADTRLWRLVERRVAVQALAPDRSRPGLRALRILNLDHGPGGIAAALAALAPQDATVVALDHLAGMAALARHRAARRHPRATLTFTQGWTSALPFPDASFDLVVTAAGLHEWPQARPSLQEIGRVLRPGGRYCLLDLRRDCSLPAWLLLRLAGSLFGPPDLKAFGEPQGSIAAAYTPREVAGLASLAGLRAHRVTLGPLWLRLEGEIAIAGDG